MWGGLRSAPQLVLGTYGRFRDEKGKARAHEIKFCLANLWLGSVCPAGQAVHPLSRARHDTGPSARGTHTTGPSVAVWADQPVTDMGAYNVPWAQ